VFALTHTANIAAWTNRTVCSARAILFSNRRTYARIAKKLRKLDKSRTKTLLSASTRIKEKQARNIAGQQVCRKTTYLTENQQQNRSNNRTQQAFRLKSGIYHPRRFQQKSLTYRRCNNSYFITRTLFFW